MLEAMLIFLIGLSVGSFLNVIIDRLPRGESIGFWTSQNDRRRSHCESCKKTLAWYDLIPILSFVFLGGKCRYCQSSLSLQYPVVELLTGAFFVGVIGVIGEIKGVREIWDVLYYLFIISSLIVVFFIDLKHGIIPDKLVFPAIFITLLYQLYAIRYLLYANFLSAFGAFLFFLILFLVTRGRGMGFGDVKLAFLMGLILGFPQIIVALYTAFLTGALTGIILVLCKVKKFRGATIPFGPFLVLGTIIALFWGEFILQKVVLVLPSLSFLLI